MVAQLRARFSRFTSIGMFAIKPLQNQFNFMKEYKAAFEELPFGRECFENIMLMIAFHQKGKRCVVMPMNDSLNNSLEQSDCNKSSEIIEYSQSKELVPYKPIETIPSQDQNYEKNQPNEEQPPQVVEQNVCHSKNCKRKDCKNFVKCTKCGKTYHKLINCANLSSGATKAEIKDFKCIECHTESSISSEVTCKTCKKHKKNKECIHCVKCQNAFHKDCIDLKKSISEKEIKEWLCIDCVIESVVGINCVKCSKEFTLKSSKPIRCACCKKYYHLDTKCAGKRKTFSKNIKSWQCKVCENS